MKISSLDFRAPSFQHPNGDTTVYEVAIDLERRYQLLQGFVTYSKGNIQNIISNQLRMLLTGKKDIKKMTETVNIKIKNLWRTYMRDETHGIISKIALEEDRQAFIDTGTYFMAIEPFLVVTR